jgi:cysteine desulfurase family protein
MSTPRRYFDNAATSFPKPPGVSDAVRDYMEHNGASAGRGAYREAMASEQLLQKTRSAVRRLFSLRDADHVIFTLNGTDALNLGIKGLLRPGDHVVTSSMDHNSVLRPLTAMRQRLGIEFTVVPADPQSTLIRPEDVRAAIRPNTRLVALNHASNVTGALQPINDVAEICKSAGVFCLIDGAQSAGHVPLSFADAPFDILATPGHKGLMGPLGTGVLLIRAGVEAHLDTLREGGTGSQSELAEQPSTLPDKYEPGSHNAAGLAGLLTAVEWIIDRGVAQLRAHEQALCTAMLEQLARCEGLTSFGPVNPEERVGVFSVRVPGFEPNELSALLEQEFGLLTRSGLHCAPWAHETIGTAESGGTTRFSTGAFVSTEDITVAGEALREVLTHASGLVGES